jgi:threonine aldolase
MPGIIDLRSDTVTRPSKGMRAAMAAAEVGDDQFGDDPTINLLQERVAALLGKESALWVPTGTMGNQVALRMLTRPGDDVIVSQFSHAVWHEAGASGANAGVQFTAIGQHGVFTLEDFLTALKPVGGPSYPPTTLVEIENTHNRAGGVVFPQAEAVRICAAAAERGISTYLDGARLWNAAIATGTKVAELAAPFDLVGVCFSKGLGAPGGSMLAGKAETIRRCIRQRRMLGGAMRQVGVFAAAAIHALDNNLERLAADHANARHLAQRLGDSGRCIVNLPSVQTNIVVFNLAPGAADAATVVARAKERGVLVVPFGVRTIRAVTHLDVGRDECERAATIITDAAGA